MRMPKKHPHPTTTKTNYWPVLQVWTWSWALQRPPGRRCRRQRPPPWGTCSPPGPLCTHRDDQYSLKTAVGVGPWGSSHHCAQSPPGSSEIVLFRPTCFTLARECPKTETTRCIWSCNCYSHQMYVSSGCFFFFCLKIIIYTLMQAPQWTIVKPWTWAV